MIKKSIKEESITNLMTPIKKLVTFAPETDIKEVILTIIKHRVSGAPVIGIKGNLLGVISEKDCLKVLVGNDYYELPLNSRMVSQYMSKEVKTLSVKCTVIEAAFEFMHSHYKRFPIVEEGKVIGQISRRDILKAIFSN